MPSFKVFTPDGASMGEYPSHAKLLLALKRFEPDGTAWVEDETGRRSLYIISSVGISQCTPHIVELIQRELKVKLEAASQDATDAKKWRALIGSGRIRVLGCAGLTSDQPSFQLPYAHLCMEIWNAYPGAAPEETERSRRLVEAYVAKLIALPRPEAIIQNTED